MTNATNSKYTKNIEISRVIRKNKNENKNKAFFPNISYYKMAVRYSFSTVIL